MRTIAPDATSGDISKDIFLPGIAYNLIIECVVSGRSSYEKIASEDSLKYHIIRVTRDLVIFLIFKQTQFQWIMCLYRIEEKSFVLNF